ncbi:hypothetical protein [Rhodococcus marinonascens]|uniref:hypothetical protein n=1 Tax=Rhodococcus marinonascens TaxID=38311 RepID=UPI000932AC2C|nr:hypothetical protein [Rhodococcus marinonascens]
MGEWTPALPGHGTKRGGRVDEHRPTRPDDYENDAEVLVCHTLDSDDGLVTNPRTEHRIRYNSQLEGPNICA